ncbi:MAG: acetyl-CoA carboxylase biotin carboxyl carrier protein subunit [Chloroflexi bacterium]|nr:acetyl-CoA carboxylase biotin carboxyl carrier protein subunit [Chloroflexota bacterium]
MSLRYRISIGGKTYDVEVGDLNTSPVRVVVNGITYEVELPGKPRPAVRPSAPAVASAPRQTSYIPVPQPVGAAPAAPTAAGPGGSQMVTAQMPGKVISVAARPGDQLTRGQPICVIESMKMELTIAAPRDCRVAAVLVSPGESVRNGQVLAEIE